MLRMGKSLWETSSLIVLHFGEIPMHPSASKNPVKYGQEMSFPAILGWDFLSALSFNLHSILLSVDSGQVMATPSCSLFTRQCSCSSEAATRAAFAQICHWSAGRATPLPELKTEMQPPNRYKKAIRTRTFEAACPTANLQLDRSEFGLTQPSPSKKPAK